MPSMQASHRAVFADAETKMSSGKLGYKATLPPASQRSLTPKEKIARELWAFHGDQNAAGPTCPGRYSGFIKKCANAPQLCES